MCLRAMLLYDYQYHWVFPGIVVAKKGKVVKKEESSGDEGYSSSEDSMVSKSRSKTSAPTGGPTYNGDRDASGIKVVSWPLYQYIYTLLLLFMLVCRHVNSGSK